MDISIVIPTHKRERLLKESLDSIFRQDYPVSEFEVIVVMDGPDEATERMLEKEAAFRPNLRYAVQEKKGPAAARNLGASLAGGELVGFTDDDCRLSEGWIRSAVSAYRRHPETEVFGGKTVSDGRVDSLVSQFLANGAISCPVNGKEEFIFFPTCNVAYKRGLLAKERFNESFLFPAGEDLEYFWKLFKKGQRFVYCQEMKVFHNRQAGILSFLRQAYMYGRGNYLVEYIHRDHPLLKEIHTESHPAFFLATLVNFLKIPRFSCLMGSKLIAYLRSPSVYRKLKVYVYFTIHKAVYLCGNITEHFKALKDCKRSLPLKEEISSQLLPDKPQLIIVDVTHRCNMQCNICDIRRDASPEELSTAQIKEIISQAKEWGVRDLALSGGEPLVREDIFQVLDFVKELGYRIGVITNGFILTEDFIGRLTPYMSCGALSLVLSLDALTPAIHDDIRAKEGAFERTVSALKMLSGLKEKDPAINFNTISIILDSNLEELIGLARFLKSTGANSIQFQPLLANNLVMKDRSEGVRYWIPRERLAVLDRVIDELVDFKEENPKLVVNSAQNLLLAKKYFRDALNPGDVSCRSAAETMLIANNAKASTCFSAYGDTRSKSLKEIWNSAKAAEARRFVSACSKPCLLPCFTD